jgi:hypothetical protein
VEADDWEAFCQQDRELGVVGQATEARQLRSGRLKKW